ncbi:hypothetical protein QJS10_CPA05g01910 [Acorus calamus]|uniref:Uncharacterized protein n=1 Tax=Acorus calamus TaxID=4465 RepID=A0AAV9ERC0_ACOCL|nr:hypothetical protein QJS10_CPA05g01910 [Acorus calamus]
MSSPPPPPTPPPPQSPHPQNPNSTSTTTTTTTTSYSIELHFDPALENQILKAWNALARRQISSRLIEIESRPHITLLSLPVSSDPSKPSPPPLSTLQQLLKLISSKSEPLPLTFSSIGTFPSASDSDGLLFLGPAPTFPLLHLHSQLVESLKKESWAVTEGYGQGAWVPHCAVARDVARARVAEAFCVLRDLKLLPVSGCAMDVGLVEYSPAAREVFSFPLGGGGGGGGGGLGEL